MTVVSPQQLAASVGYSVSELRAVLPDGSNLGLGCGNPVALGALQPGDTVLDLGSGAGIDVFLAAAKVAPTGNVIGVDMTAEMVERARANAKRSALGEFVEFRLGEIENLPVADASVDVVLSNCVINLSARKQRVWNEIYRVLRDGGRVQVSDVVLLKPLPAAVKKLASAWIGCVAGASLCADVKAMMTAAGLHHVHVELHDDYVRSLCDANDPLYAQIKSMLPESDNDVTTYVSSASITATKAPK